MSPMPVAKEKRPGKAQKRTGEGKEPVTSTGLYVTDSRRLSSLASLRGESVAECFRNVFGKLLQTTVIAMAGDPGNSPPGTEPPPSEK